MRNNDIQTFWKQKKEQIISNWEKNVFPKNKDAIFSHRSEADFRNSFRLVSRGQKQELHNDDPERHLKKASEM